MQDVAKIFGLTEVSSIPGDASSRRYSRAKRDGKSVISMLYPDSKSQSEIELKNFLKIRKILNNQGIRVPECYEHDVSMNRICAIIEDLGESSFGALLKQTPENSKTLYKKATKTLIEMAKIQEIQDLPPYKKTKIYENRRQLIDYYSPLKKGECLDESCVEEFFALWDEIELSLPPCPQGFVHGDYHLENLIYMPNETGMRQCALIDFQDAFYGPLPYDLLNLLEDARIDVLKDIRIAMIELYTKEMKPHEKETFLAWYKVLAAQFHGRVLGLFIKFAVEKDRSNYLTHIPRLQNYLKNALKDPLLEPLNSWFKKHNIDFNPTNNIDMDLIRTVFKNV